jgi:DNA-binding NarL/FixJ family response regulator
MSFLIVDDNSVMRRTIRRVVRDFAARIIECDDGAKAFHAYELHHPDWVLMDVEMTEQDGLTATREICVAYPNARVVIVTKYDDAAMREAARKAGAWGFVVKENLLELRGILMAVNSTTTQ